MPLPHNPLLLYIHNLFLAFFTVACTFDKGNLTSAFRCFYAHDLSDFFSTGLPPDWHCPTGLLPLRSQLQDRNILHNHPLQLFPGRTSKIASSRSSTSTLNFSPKIPRIKPIRIPVPPYSKTGDNNCTLHSYPFLLNHAWEAHKGDRHQCCCDQDDRSSWKRFGISLYSISHGFRTIITIAIKNLTDVANPFTTPL